MDDLISRQAAIDAINSGIVTDDDGVECPSECNSMLEWAVNAVKELPTADLSEYSDKLWKTADERGKAGAHPKKGKWIKDRLSSTCGGSYGVYRCSECENSYQDIGYGWNYCPNCGARMEE